jgi:hypothetical protein
LSSRIQALNLIEPRLMCACNISQAANVLRVEFKLSGVLAQLRRVFLKLFRLFLQLAGHLVNGRMQRFA